MYNVYTTRGFVLGSIERGESNKVFLIYTENFGLVRALAQGVRLEASKLRYSIDDFVYGEFSLVRGRELWRLTGSSRIDGGSDDIATRQTIARVLHLVRRLVHGEEKNELLFDALLSMHERSVSVSNSMLFAFELISLLRVLSALGYLGAITPLSPTIISGSITDHALENVSSFRSDALALVNGAIERSHL